MDAAGACVEPPEGEQGKDACGEEQHDEMNEGRGGRIAKGEGDAQGVLKAAQRFWRQAGKAFGQGGIE